MASVLLVCLILADILFFQAMATKYVQTAMGHKRYSFVDSLTLLPVHSRKLGQLPYLSKQHISLKVVDKHSVETSRVQVTLSAPNPAAEENYSKEGSPSHQTDSTEPENQKMENAEAPGNTTKGKHPKNDKSVFGGGVILGGLATTFFVSIICYIRVTRKRDGVRSDSLNGQHNAENSSDTSSESKSLENTAKV